jgi:hypothetical protein
MSKIPTKKILLFLARCSPLLFVVGPLFFTNGYLFFTDFVWGPHMALDWTSGSFLMTAVIKGLSFALPLDLIQKFYLTLCLGLALWGGRKIVGLFLKTESLVFVASLFALFNPFTYDRAMYGQFGIVGAFGLLLMGIGFLLEYSEKKQARQILYAGVSFAFAVQFSPHFFFFIAASYLFVFLPFFFADRSGSSNGLKTKLTELAKISALIAVIAVALNANWLIGSFTAKSGIADFVNSGITRQDLVAFQTAGTTGGGALMNVLMMSGFWGKDMLHYADLTRFSDDWGRSFIVLLPLILWGFIVGARSKEKKCRALTIGSAALFVVSVILAAGIRIPVGRELTYFLFDHLPFYKGLRETQKWVSLTVAAYLVFLSLGVRELFATAIVRRNATVMKLFIGAVIVMQAPLLLFGFDRQVPPAQYPSDWAAVDARIVHDSGCSGETLFLPWHLYMQFSWLGRDVANPAPVFFRCPVVSGTDMEWANISDNSQNPQSAAIEKWLTMTGAAALPRTDGLDIRYVILTKEVDWKKYAWLDADPELRLVMKTATLRLYEVKQP